MKHPHVILLEDLYKKYTAGNFKAFLEGCADSFTFQIAGKSKLAGKFTKSNFIAELAMKQKELSGGTYQLEVHDILGSDLHATVLGTAKVVRDGKTVELRTVHVWRFENGKPLAGYEYPRDLYQFDSLWG